MPRAVLEWGMLKESFLMAISAIRGSKLRSILTLLGIVVGIFSIISVMTAVGVLQNSIEGESFPARCKHVPGPEIHHRF